VQREVLELLRGFDGDTFLVGHALDGDLKYVHHRDIL
jgi:hypothetical protein